MIIQLDTFTDSPDPTRALVDSRSVSAVTEENDGYFSTVAVVHAGSLAIKCPGSVLSVLRLLDAVRDLTQEPTHLDAGRTANELGIIGLGTWSSPLRYAGVPAVRSVAGLGPGMDWHAEQMAVSAEADRQRSMREQYGQAGQAEDESARIRTDLMGRTEARDWPWDSVSPSLVRPRVEEPDEVRGVDRVHPYAEMQEEMDSSIIAGLRDGAEFWSRMQPQPPLEPEIWDDTAVYADGTIGVRPTIILE